VEASPQVASLLVVAAYAAVAAGILFFAGSLVLILASLLFRRFLVGFDRHCTRLWTLHMDIMHQMEAASHLDAWNARMAENRRRRAEERRVRKAAKQGLDGKKPELNDDAA